ncbi:MAG TPA: DinB family protein [Actinomycetota bacterium]|nr:DinB family protein [Actinomycetota bacterium]
MGRDHLVEGRLSGYDPDVGAALWRLEDARARTLELVSTVGPTLVDESVEGNSIGTILYHIALIEADWLYTDILGTDPPEWLISLLPHDHRDEHGVLTRVTGMPLATHLASLAAVRTELLAELRSMDSADLHRPRNLDDYDVSPAWVLHHLAQHEAEHRAEIGAAVARLSGERDR